MKQIKLHNRQSIALLTKGTEVLFGGAAGGGKSFLIRVASIFWATEIPGLQVYLFRRLSDDLYKNHMTGTGSFPDLMADWMESKKVKFDGQKNVLKFWNRSAIWLCHCQYEKDLLKYQGAEIGVLVIDEGTHFTGPMYRYLRGRVRLGSTAVPDKYKGMLPRVLVASNPGGIGHSFFKSEFIDPSEPYRLRRMPKSEGGLLRQYIPARLTDNPTLMENDPNYADRLSALGDPILVRAMLEGDWNIVAGGALDDVWGPWLIAPRFAIPEGWRVIRSFDWGSAHPFSVGWWAISNGEEIRVEDGETLCFPSGTLIRLHEWYGAENIEENEGLKLSAKEIAVGILKIEQALKVEGWIPAGVKVKGGPADNQIFNVNEKESESIALKMKECGVSWERSDKSKGSRINGLQLLRDRMTRSRLREGPGIIFMDHCRAAITTLPVLPRDKYNREDVDTQSIDHCYDEIRYMVIALDRKPAKLLKTSMPGAR